MALTPIQRHVCRLLAEARRAGGESYIAGGVALSVALRTQRISRDLDIFHDTTEAVAASFERDRAILEAAGYRLQLVRERPGYVEALVERDEARLVIEWTRESAFRFFPLVEDDALGLTLHPFDLATNKVLALVGRLEPRDWIDVVACHDHVQPLGYLAWAASGKDPGFTPSGILGEASRSARYTDAELSALAFDGKPPRAADLSQRWHKALDEARAIVERLPPASVGEAVVTADGELFRSDIGELERTIGSGQIRFHPGRIGGAFPSIRA